MKASGGPHRVRKLPLDQTCIPKRRPPELVNEFSAVTNTVKDTMPLVDDGFEALLEPFYNGKKLTDPVNTRDDKFQLLPAFLKVKGE